MDLQLAGFRFDELTVPKEYLFYIEMAGLANGTRGSKSGDILILFVKIGLLILIFFLLTTHLPTKVRLQIPQLNLLFNLHRH